MKKMCDVCNEQTTFAIDFQYCKKCNICYYKDSIEMFINDYANSSYYLYEENKLIYRKEHTNIISIKTNLSSAKDIKEAFEKFVYDIKNNLHLL